MQLNACQRRYLVVMVSLFFLPLPAAAQDKAAVRCTAVHGALLTASKDGWSNISAKTDVLADRLVVALFGAEFTSPNGAVGLKMIADVGQRGPFPVLEAAASFQ